MARILKVEREEEPIPSTPSRFHCPTYTSLEEELGRGKEEREGDGSIACSDFQLIIIV